MTAPKYTVRCPICGEPPYAPCRTRGEKRRVTDTHVARINLQWAPKS